jgi:hypothetical protein
MKIGDLKKKKFYAKFTIKTKKMSLILNYLILSAFMFGVVTALYVGLKTIKLI